MAEEAIRVFLLGGGSGQEEPGMMTEMAPEETTGKLPTSKQHSFLTFN